MKGIVKTGKYRIKMNESNFGHCLMYNMILYILNRQEQESFINNILYKSKIPDSLPDKKMNHRQPDGCFLNIWFIDLMININNKQFDL